MSREDGIPDRLDARGGRVSCSAVLRVGEVVTKRRDPLLSKCVRDRLQRCVPHRRGCTMAEHEQMGCTSGAKKECGDLPFLCCCSESDIGLFQAGPPPSLLLLHCLDYQSDVGKEIESAEQQESEA